MELLHLLQHSVPLFLTCVGIFGLLLGSFFNVVIYRLPRMLHQQWQQQAHEYLSGSDTTSPTPSWITSRSQCPHCAQPIAARDNIPLLSYLLLRGRCRSCQQAIAWRYPFIELLATLVSVVTAYHFGFTWLTLAALLLTWVLLILSAIDIEHQLLPDDLTLPCLWMGLLLNTQGLFVSLSDAVFGAILGYLFLWSIYWAFKIITHKEGMGYGDFKLFALLGAWLGWQSLLPIILLATCSGAFVGIFLIVCKYRTREQPLPFGPFLAIAGWIYLVT